MTNSNNTPFGNDISQEEIQESQQAEKAQSTDDTTNGNGSQRPDNGEQSGQGDQGNGSGKNNAENGAQNVSNAELLAKNEELSKQLEDYGKNLSGQSKALKKARQQIQEMQAQNNQEKSEKPFPEVKYTKDLSQSERDEMTDSEQKLFDQNAQLQEQFNKMWENSEKDNGKGTDDDDDSGDDSQGGDDGEESGETNVNATVRGEAIRLADGDKDKANQIIEASKMFSFDGLNEEQTKERVAQAQKLTQSYQPQKEQQTQSGQAPSDQKSSDPYGVDQYVDDQNNDGLWSL